MKIKEGFVVREIAGQSIVVALGAATKTFNGMIKLNQTGRTIWDLISQGKEREEIIQYFLSEYDIDRASVEKDVDTFINTLQGANILE